MDKLLWNHDEEPYETSHSSRERFERYVEDVVLT